jgi:hypothetical protein
VSTFFQREGRDALTNAEGRFELTDLPAGKYFLNAGKAGYVSFPSQDDRRPRDPIELSDGQTVEKVVIALTRGGVIAGQVLDEAGEPLIGAEIRALRYRYVDGRRQLTQVFTANPGSALTDDLGAFRLFGLAPGDYYVSASGGRDTMLGGSAPRNAEGPTQTYYPGTANPSDARRITVRPGRETNAVIFSVVVMRLARVSGLVQTSSGDPFVGSVSVTQRDASYNRTSFGGPIRPDGSFTVGNLPPGTYILTARPNYGPTGERDNTLVGRTEVTISGEDLEDVLILAGEGGRARGRVITDDGGALPLQKGARVMGYPFDQTMSFEPPKAGAINPDGTFEITGLLGAVRLNVDLAMASPPVESGGWTFKSLLVDGRDVTDSGIDFQHGRLVEDIDVVFTRKVTRLSGELHDAQGNVPQDTWIVVFPSDEAKWTPRSRFVRVARPDKSGSYRLVLTPHDDYLIVAAAGLEEGQWTDPEFLRAAKESAERLAIAEGETKVHNPRLVDWRR